MRVRAAGLILVLLVGLQFFNSRGLNDGTTTPDIPDETYRMDDAQFPEGIPPFCLDPETQTKREMHAVPIHIEIDIDDHRSWVTNAFEAWLGLTTSEARGITDQSKGNYGASIALTYPDGHRCVDRAQIRLQGDHGDHLKPGPKGIETSLDSL